ncbi:MAG: hypothetical protein NTV11_00780 [Rhodocyclales bacterium]|nr:hypothetical protein [Rhodocyclales bacterium]
MERRYLNCKICNYEGHFYSERPIYAKWRVYKTDAGALFPVLNESMWCPDCEKPTMSEKWPTAEEIESSLTDYAEAFAAFQKGVGYENKSLARLHESFIASAQTWRSFASQPRRTRCLICGSSQLLSHQGEGPFYFLHRSCSQPLFIKESPDTGLRLSPKNWWVMSEGVELDIHSYTTDGLPAGDTLEKFRKEYPETASIVEKATREEIAKQRGVHSTQPIDGEDDLADFFRLFRMFVSKELAGVWLPNEPGNFKDDYPEIYPLVCHYVRQTVVKSIRENETAVQGSASSGPLKAICFKCGLSKDKSFAVCGSCGIQPKTESELAMSLVFSEHISPPQLLRYFALDIKNGQHIDVDPETYAKARVALADQQLMTALRDRESETQRHLGPKAGTSGAQLFVGGKESSIHRTAFWVLGATVRDSSKRVIELADERALHIDQDLCQKARSALTNPRSRLAAEMAWLPGVSPNKANEAALALLSDPAFVLSDHGLPLLARANLMASAMGAINEMSEPSAVSDFILQIAQVAEEIRPDQILRDINEDRTVSGFPVIPSVELIETALVERIETYKRAIRDALNNLSPTNLVKTMTLASGKATNNGEMHGPVLFDELVDTYESETQEFLVKEAENVSLLVKKTMEVAPKGEAAVGVALDRIENVARNWGNVARPIQISKKARGIVHRPSRDMAGEMRDLAGDLYQKHDMTAAARRITNFLAELFVALPEFAELLEKDTEALATIERREKLAESKRGDFAKEIAFEERIGAIFKDTLAISTAGIRWNKDNYPLDTITRVRWGGIRRSVNGVPQATEYTMAFGDDHDEVVVSTRDERLYSSFVDKLWKAVCARIMTDILNALKDGKEISFGDAVVDDTGASILERHTFKADVIVYCKWSEMTISSSNGEFVMGMAGKNTYSNAPYINGRNSHLLEHLVRLAKQRGVERLSDLL